MNKLYFQIAVALTAVQALLVSCNGPSGPIPPISQNRQSNPPSYTDLGLLEYQQKRIASYEGASSEDGFSEFIAAQKKGHWIDLIVTSPDGKHVAFRSHQDSSEFIVLDGGEGKRYDSVGKPVFSPDSQNMAYPATKGSSQFIVMNGIEGRQYDLVGELSFSHDSKKLAYPAVQDSLGLVVVNGEESGRYKIRIQSVLFSPDNKGVAYMATENDKWLIILNGEFGRYYDYVSHPVFSPDGNNFVYYAQLGNKSFLVINGIEQEQHDFVIIAGFSPDGNRFAYVAKENNQFFTIVDGQKGKAYDYITLGPTFSPDGKKVAYVAKNEDKWYVVTDGAESNPYDDVKLITFSPDSKRSVFAARENVVSGWSVVENGREGKRYYDIKEIVFSPDSRKLVFTATDAMDPKPDLSKYNQNARFIVVDGVESEKYVMIQNPIFSPDSTNLVFLTSDSVYEPRFSVNVYGGIKSPTYVSVRNITFEPTGLFYFIAQKASGFYQVNYRYALLEEKGYYQYIVDAMRSLQPSDIPKNLTTGNSTRTVGDFDIDRYFLVLKHLNMEPGYVLDYVYVYDGLFGGRPIIYVRKTSQKPFADYQSFAKAKSDKTADNVFGFVALVMGESNEPIEDKIKLDGTAESYFEYVVLQIMGGQFYLAWHAGYDDAIVVTGNSSLERILEDSQLPVDVQMKARRLKLEPVIKFQADTVKVRVLIFTKWGGFIETITTIRKDYPHQIINIESRTLVKYDSGIVF